MRGTWSWWSAATLLVAGSCSVNTDYEYAAEPSVNAGTPSQAGRAGARNTGGVGGSGPATGLSCSDEPCKNGGTCHQGASGVACSCPSGFSGPTCEEGLGGRANAAGGRASASGGVAVAGSGGAPASSGGLTGTGGFDHPCFPNPCLNNGYCELEGDRAVCECNGYEGPLCADDIDECALEPGPCAEGETCRNYPGTYGCPCPAGLTGENCELPMLEWLALPEGWRACFPKDVSADGVVVTGYCTVTPTGKRAFRWTHEDGFATLGNLGVESEAEAISADGSVIAGAYTDAAGRTSMFRWTSATGMRGEIGLEDENGSHAFDVSGDGSVVVGVSYPGQGFRWTSGERLSLGTRELGGATAWGVSADGEVVVGHAEGVAFRWTAATGLVPLPAPPQGGVTSARAISPDGRIIAGYGDDAGGLIWRGDTVEVVEGIGTGVSAVSNTGIVLSGGTVWNGRARTAEEALQDAGIELDQNVTAIAGVSPDGRYFVGYGSGGAFIARSLHGN